MPDYNRVFELVQNHTRLKWDGKNVFMPCNHPGAKDPWGADIGLELVDYDFTHDCDPSGNYWYRHIGGPFDAILEPVDFDRGRSATNVYVKDVSRGHRYLLSAFTYIDLVKETHLTKGRVKGNFIISKRGANYRIEQSDWKP